MSSLITMTQLMTMSKLSRCEIEDAVKSGELGQPLPLGPWSFGWDAEVVKYWILSLEDQKNGTRN